MLKLQEHSRRVQSASYIQIINNKTSSCAYVRLLLGLSYLT